MRLLGDYGALAVRVSLHPKIFAKTHPGSLALPPLLLDGANNPVLCKHSVIRHLACLGLVGSESMEITEYGRESHQHVRVCV
jgi:hypothetical protein